MRPRVLFPLFAEVTSIKGVGARIGDAISRLAGPHVVDLLWHLPSGFIDRRYAPRIGEAEPDRIATLTVVVDKHLPPPAKRLPYKIRCRDETGFLHLVFFHAKADYLERELPEGETRVVSGKLERYRDEIQITHPDHIGKVEDLPALMALEPTYPLTANLTPKPLRRAIAAALDLAPDLPEWIEPSVIERQGWASWQTAIKAAHEPQSQAELDALAPARARLAYDELLASQLALLLIRASVRRQRGRPLKGDRVLTDRVEAALPFSLTGSQRHAIAEIAADMGSPDRMMRLLQGDVGSGKTVVALLAMLTAVEAGTQAVLMAPTEILARQHHATIAPMAEAAGVKVAILTGRDKGGQRQEILDGLASGAVQIAVGTHALFQEAVDFHDLGLAVIDEQHRFGVHQRLTLSAKGANPDTLVMTATPIPRTLLLAAYGDMDSSRLTEKPAGRQPVDTRAVPLSRLGDVVEGVKRALGEDARVYWVTPLVEESETSDLAAATERYDLLRALLGDVVGMVHGRLKGPEKDKVMAEFKDGRKTVLVATTVIEVGVDVPEATVMVIEHAERFGLAQLHQLRGRIGRGAGRSTCLLLYASPLGEMARARIQIMRDTERRVPHRRGRPPTARRRRSLGHAAERIARFPAGRPCRAWRSAWRPRATTRGLRSNGTPI